MIISWRRSIDRENVDPIDPKKKPKAVEREREREKEPLVVESPVEIHTDTSYFLERRDDQERR